ncbi:replication initiation factor domain-containing protein [Leuconostoc suionicum]|uniref:replication initiation factor domain-containing protein n=1 Tax=Leuconostoc suionicum TaxID=1511761 RepID=UPI0024ACB49B|nr:replication initiation factor domain-containing protein [Leuconostoc suionicum]MDI6498926.1 replication initiation factor domain-containing protein [Leuconostoc suionicum]MDI6500820.1 replication initiation factor domain-containing protein [Leuconostoc suionicum]MDI6551828.1 replication initiation factor domain-containing protein [Leuconostoc suionicum]
MITINHEPKAYTPIFLGTIQHSIRLSLEIMIMIGMKWHDEIIETYNVTVSAIALGQLPNIGSKIAIDEITGSELSGFKAKMSQSDAQSKNTVSTELEQLVDLKNVGRYQLLKGKNAMTQKLNVPELTNNNLILMRQLLSVTQEELAITMGINEKTIRRIENKEQGISERFVNRLLAVYPDLAQSIEVQFDWVSLTFPDLTSKQVIKDILSIQSDLFLERPTSQNFYTREMAFAGEKNIYIQDFSPIKNPETQAIEQKYGTTLYLTGKGTRLFEKALLEQNITWHDFFQNARQYRGHLTRLDIAINDKWGLLNMNDLVKAVQEKRFWSKSKSYAVHGNVDDGWTVNFGKSPFVIRAYDKRKEQAIKGFDTDVQNRVELELHQDKAEYVLDEWLNHDKKLVDITFDILYTYLWFTNEPIDTKKLKSDKVREVIEATVEPLPAWSLLTALGNRMKFVRQPKKQGVERIENWVLQSVVPSLAVLKKTGHWNEIVEAINSVELTAEHQKLVEANLVNAITQARSVLHQGNINFDKEKEKYVEETAEFEKQVNLPF